MRLHLKQLIAVWFLLQIVLPFTAPLQTCDLRDLLGATNHQSHPISPESYTTPTVSQTGVDAASFPSPMDAASWGAVIGRVSGPASPRPLMAARDLSPSSQVQRTVLRL